PGKKSGIKRDDAVIERRRKKQKFLKYAWSTVSEPRANSSAHRVRDHKRPIEFKGIDKLRQTFGLPIERVIAIHVHVGAAETRQIEGGHPILCFQFGKNGCPADH